MRLFVGISLILLSILFEACNSTPAPTAPQSQQIPAVPLSVVGYGESLDSTYFKVWSDSSSEGFFADTIINGTQYSIILDNAGNETLYGPDGYAGFGQYGGSIVLFDSSLPSLPDTMIGGTAYSRQTTFSYQGGSYVLVDLETLVDTTTISVPFGTFTDCRVLQSLEAINGVLQSATVYWLAKGPSDIARQYNSGYGAYNVLMAYGMVNGQSWGVNPGLIGRKEGASAATNNQAADIRSLAPKILQSIIRFRSVSPASRHSQSASSSR